MNHPVTKSERSRPSLPNAAAGAHVLTMVRRIFGSSASRLGEKFRTISSLDIGEIGFASAKTRVLILYGTSVLSFLTGCSSVMGIKVAPTVSVTPSSANISLFQGVTVSVKVIGIPSTVVPTSTVALASGSYSSDTIKLSNGGAGFSIPAGSLPTGNDTLIITYTPDPSSSGTYATSSGTASVTVTGPIAPTVMATPSSADVASFQELTVSVKVIGPSGAPAPTGSVKVASGSYTSGAIRLSNGGASFSIPAGSLATGDDTLTITYAPDASSSTIYASASGTASVTVTGRITPTVLVTPASQDINTQQSLNVTVAVSGGTSDPSVTGSVSLTSGSYRSGAQALTNGSTTVNFPAASLMPGTDTLSATYTPDAGSSSVYASASGSSVVNVNRITPTVSVTPASTTIDTAQDLPVIVALSALSGEAIPTGSVELSGGGFTSSSTALSNGSAKITIPAGALAVGSDILSATYTADSASANIYSTANGSSAAVSVRLISNVMVGASTGLPVTDQPLGMNIAVWDDIDAYRAGIQNGFSAAGIKAVRWPATGDEYHWASNTVCSGFADPNSTYINFINDLESPLGLDVALTANYGTNETCTGPGDPTEAANWVSYAEANGGHVSHMTVGSEEYGTWETDMHAKPHDPSTYANATATGYYPAIKAVDDKVLVGVSVNPANPPAWDPIVLANAKYDFVEYHYYPQAPGSESDAYLVRQAAQDLTGKIGAIKQELQTAGRPDVPVYVGEIGSVWDHPGKQTWSITQGLFAGQVLGEMMNAGVSRLTWWIGFGECNGGDPNSNNSASLYGWQDWGAYNVFPMARRTQPARIPAP